ncbi:helix-turn-helix transcriptional regulator [Mycobacterium sp. 852002-10029_SCH5224772]|uniref:helix-turn-helix domain-containing protein n=1 Tax=Mycobacterium sp. 852002-10029_SCH5224772 TaxID=1834083 RepID=UPI0008002218|nr:helix-turn-helix transcriptional regulator [Mycobacterium sp. 852002-10029_SCH5224772]OBF09582.1 transcriptional regulator [Mycobacterium sp. 852002-10029_SCH5224772]
MKAVIAMSDSHSIDIHEAGLALNLPDLIFETRAGADMNQEQLAHALGTTRAEVAAWESGDEVPRVDVLQRLAEVCGKRLHIRIDVD